jgi:hypothetical protein
VVAPREHQGQIFFGHAADLDVFSHTFISRASLQRCVAHQGRPTLQLRPTSRF